MTENDFKKIAGNSSNFLDYTKKVTDILKNNNNSLTGEEAGLMNKVWDDYDKNKI